MSATLQHALKEWLVAVEALVAGQTVMLLRKGGIREQAGRFQVERDRVLLFPTVEHQNPAALKPAYAGRVSVVPSGWHPETVTLTSWAQITDVLPLRDRAALDRLFDYHIWSRAAMEQRWQWRPQHPLTVLLLRVYRLALPIQLPYRREYGGCRSWLELPEPLVLGDSQPVLAAAPYERQVTAIRAAIAPPA